MSSRSRLSVFAVSIALFVFGASEAEQGVSLEDARDPVTIQDLANLASEFGLNFRMFDYEVTHSNCMQFLVDITINEATSRHKGSEICGLGGPERLTVYWQLKDTNLLFTFKIHRRDNSQLTSVSGPNIVLPNVSGHTLSNTRPPVLAPGRETVLLDGTYGLLGPMSTEFKVVAELRPNPDDVVGTR